MKVHAFPLDRDGKVAGPARTLVDFAPENGCDGMTVDTAGNVFISGSTGADTWPDVAAKSVHVPG